MIYCLGNSHAAMFSGAPPCADLVPKANQFKNGVGDACNPNPQYPELRTVYLGGVLSYNFTQKHLPNVYHWLDKLDASKEEDTLLFIVGEIDCRWHLPKKIDEQNLEVKDVVAECIDRFFESFLQLKKEGWSLIVCGTQPTTTGDHLGPITAGEPRWGSCEFRNSICKTWNDYMQSKCDDSEIEFISIYENLVDENNITNMEYFKDYCHLIYDKCFPMFLRELQRVGHLTHYNTSTSEGE